MFFFFFKGPETQKKEVMLHSKTQAEKNTMSRNHLAPPNAVCLKKELNEKRLKDSLRIFPKEKWGQ